MSLSASVHHPTAGVENRLSREDVARLVLSWTCAIIGFGGFMSLFWLLAAVANDGHVTNRTLVMAALAVTATVCGMFGAGLSASAQRAADRGRKQQEQRDAEVEEMRAIREEMAADRAARVEHAEVMRQFLAHEAEVGERSAKARTDIAKIHENVTELRLAVGLVTQEMPSEDAILGTMRAYIDTIFRQFRDQLDKMQPPRQQRPPKRQQRPREPREDGGSGGPAGKVLPLRSRRAADALRRLTEQIEGPASE